MKENKLHSAAGRVPVASTPATYGHGYVRMLAIEIKRPLELEL